MNYHEIAFSEAVKELQTAHGSRDKYQGVYGRYEKTGFSDSEVSFIHDQDSFFMATVGKSGFPYIQHRGGPKGFLRVIDDQTLGFVDFSGNRQYISTGNLAENDTVALFLISYPHQSRLKIFARASIVELADNPDLFAQLDPADYKHTPERMMILKVEGFDWNCPQHITQRFTVEEVDKVYGPKLKRLEEIEAEIERLKTELSLK